MEMTFEQAQNVNTSQETNAPRDGINRAMSATHRLQLLDGKQFRCDSRKSTLQLLEAAGLKVIERDYQGYQMSFITPGGAA